MGSAAYSATSIVVVMAKDNKGSRGSKGAKGGGASSGQVNPLPPSTQLPATTSYYLQVRGLMFSSEFKKITEETVVLLMRKMSCGTDMNSTKLWSSMLSCCREIGYVHGTESPYPLGSLFAGL